MARMQTDPEILAWGAQEDARQAVFDRKCEAAPKCEHCGESVYLGEKYLDFDGVCYCEECIREHMENTEGMFDDA